MNAPQQHPSRINEKLIQYWDELRGNRPLPLESEINTDALKDIWGACFLITVKPNGFAYDYLGGDLLAAYGDDLTGREITETLLYPHPKALFEQFGEVKKTARPATDENEFTNSRQQNIKYRSSVVPFAARERDGVSFLLGGMRWKAF